MEKDIKKLLVALDGSERSLNTVRQVAYLKAFRHKEIVLFNVFSGVPEAYYDLAKEPQSVQNFAAVRAWENQRKKEVQSFMDRSRDILVTAGFSEKNIKIRIWQRQKGIARDILEEARHGYGALVLRRRGTGQIPEIVMGSVAIKIMEKASFIPVVIIGQKPVNEKFLLAMDGSDGAVKALDFAGNLLHGVDCRLQLTHVIRENGTFEVVEIVENLKGEMQSMLDENRERLLQIGFKADQVTTKILTGEASRAGAIVKEADAGDFATIVMGRRGLSRVQEFFMGRVSNKVLYAARKNSVWIIS